jgi:hypothetical protein
MRYPILHLDFPIPVTIGSGRVVIDDAGVMRLDLFSPEEQIVVMEKMAPIERAVPERPEHHETCCQSGEGTVDDELSCDAECWCHSMPHLASDMPESGPWALQRMCNCSERQAKWDRGETAPACPIHGPDLVLDDAIDEKLAPYDPRAAGTLYPTDGLYHHGCCGCPDCRGGFAGRQQSSKEVAQPCGFTMPHPPHGFISPFARDGLYCPGIQPPDPVIEEQLEDRLDYDARGQNYTQMQADTNPWGKVVLTVCGSGKGDGCGAVVYDKEQHDLFHVKTRSKM